MLLELRDPEAYIRSLAAQALTRSYADSARLAPSAVADLLLRAAEDPSPQVRINAIRSLGSYTDPALASGALGQARPHARRSAGRRAGAGGRDARGAWRRGGGQGARPRGRREGHLRVPSSRPGGPRSRRFRRVHAGGGPLARQWRLARPSRRRGGCGPRGTGPLAGVSGRPRRPRHRRGAPGVGGRGRGPRRGVARGRPAAARAPGRRRAKRRGRRRGAGGRSGRPDGPRADVRRHRPRLLSGGRPLGPGRHPRDPEDRAGGAGAGRPRVPARRDPAAELSAPAVGRGQLARGGRALGTGAPDRHRPVAAGLS